jgi:hypothetical protein
MYKACIENGIKLLDEIVPEWEKDVDIYSLDLECPSGCILGQVFGSYSTGLCTLFGYESIEFDWDIIYPQIVAHGFSCDHYSQAGQPFDYAQLTDEWIETLQKRKEEHKQHA